MTAICIRSTSVLKRKSFVNISQKVLRDKLTKSVKRQIVMY